MSALVEPEGASSLLIVRKVEAAPEEVWRCLTDPDCFKVWWNRNVDLDGREGGRFCAPWIDVSGQAREIEAQVTAFHPPRGLVMVWADRDWTFDTVVSIWIEPDGEGSRITLEHQGWHAAPEAERTELLAHHRNGWTDHLTNWATHAEGLRGRGTDD